MNIGFAGGTGFVGSRMIRRFVNSGHTVTCLVRIGEAAHGLGMPGGTGVTLIEGDLADVESLKRAFSGCNLVVNLVGIIREVSGSTFESVHVEGTSNLVHAARESGAERFIQMSSLGARPDAKSRYHQTKWRAEEIVRESGLPWTIFRPSIIFGRGDGFTTTLQNLITRAPLIPVIGSGANLIQPISIEDVKSCFVAAATEDNHLSQTYELGGPEQLRFEDILRTMARQMGSYKPRVHLPVWLMAPLARLLSRINPRFPLTPDQIILLREDNITDHNAAEEVFHLTLTPFSEGLKRLLRP